MNAPAEPSLLTIGGALLLVGTVFLAAALSALRRRERALETGSRELQRQLDQRTLQLQEARARLVREQSLLPSILDQVGDGVVAIDASGRSLLWNRRAQEILGMGPADVDPSRWAAHFGIRSMPGGATMTPDDLPLVQALKGETVRGSELFVHNDHNGSGRWVSLFARPLEAGVDSPAGAVALLVDIQDSRRRREQREMQSAELARIGRLALIGQIVETTAHRLSQPLAAIANYAGAAIQLRRVDALDGERLEEILEHIIRLAERGGENLGALRRLTRRGPRDEGEVDVNAVVQSSLQLLEERLQRQQVTVEQELAPALPPVLGQSVELQQVVIHLLINAMEALAVAAPPRRLRLATRVKAGSDCVRIEVGDNGAGVPPDLRREIFEPWCTTRPGALGLGLAVARSIIDTHNGKIALRDDIGDMTWFDIEIPAVRRHE